MKSKTSSKLWSVFNNWSFSSQATSWNSYDLWKSSYCGYSRVISDRLENALIHWDKKLADIGGEPGREDWLSFRPLRLAREEDWSDWLAHLLECSRSGRFLARVVNKSPGNAWLVREAQREISVNPYRADIILDLADNAWIDIEVKIGDCQFHKSFGTARTLEAELAGKCRGHYILLPEENIPEWEEVLRTSKCRDVEIGTLTWNEIARSLRQSICEKKYENINWRVFARTFLGAIEQKILGFVPILRNASKNRNIKVGLKELERIEILDWRSQRE